MYFSFPMDGMGVGIKYPPYGALMTLNIPSSLAQSKPHITVICDRFDYPTCVESAHEVAGSGYFWEGEGGRVATPHSPGCRSVSHLLNEHLPLL